MSYDQEMQDRWITRRDANAFAELVQRHADMVFATCRRVLGDATEAEDVAQECFMELAGTASVVAPSLGGWLHRVAVFRSRNRNRNAHRRKVREGYFAGDQDTIVTPDWDDIKPHLDDAIAELPEKFRLAVIHRFLEGETQEGVAKALGVSRSTAQYRIERGVDEIRKFLKGRGVTAAAATLVALVDAGAADAASARLVADLGKQALAAYPPASEGAGATISGVNTGFTLIGGKMVALIALALVLVVGGAFYGADRWERAPENDDVPRGVRQEGAVRTTTPSIQAIVRAEGESGEPMGNESSEAASPVVAGSARVFGRVFAAKNTVGLSGFVVEAYAESTRPDGKTEPVAETATDADGQYTLPALSDGRYKIYAHDDAVSYNFMRKNEPGRSSAPMRGGRTNVRVDKNVGDIQADIEVDAGLCLVGQVMFPDDTPAAGVSVWARGENGETKYWAERESDSTGRFVFLGLEPGSEVFLQASSDTHASSVGGPYRIEDVDGQMPILVLREAASIAGVVVDSVGRPAHHAKVWLRPDTPFIVHPRFLIADEAGRVEALGLEAATYDFLLAPIGSQRLDERTNITHFHWGSLARVYPDEVPVLRLALGAGDRRTGLRIGAGGTEIGGRVTDVAGRAIGGISISIMGRGKVKTDMAGRFTLTGLPEDVYVVHAFHEDYRSQRRDDIPSGTRDVQFVLEVRGEVELQVTDGRTGKPIPEFRVYTGADRPYEGWMETWYREHKDPEGRFTYKPNFVAERIFVQARGFAPGSVPVSDVSGGEPPTRLDLTLEAAIVVSGIVTRANGEPVRGATIFRAEVPQNSRARRDGALAQTDAAGRFVLDTLPLESVRLVAWHEAEGFGHATTPGVEDTGDEIKIVLAKAGTVEGTVTASGQPSAGVAVRVIRMPEVLDGGVVVGGPTVFGTGKTNELGVFRFGDVPVGTVQIAGDLDRRSRSVNVDVVSGKMTMVTIDFPPLTATLEGRLRTEDGQSPGSGTVTFAVQGPEGREFFHVESDAEGSYRIDGLPAGSVEVRVRFGTAIPLVLPELWEIEEGAAMIGDINVADGIPIGRVVEREDSQVQAPLIAVSP